MAWKIIHSKPQSNLYRRLVKAPVDESDLENIASRWRDNVYRNEMIHMWVQKAKAEYLSILNEAKRTGV